MTMATGSPTHRTRSAGSGGCGATKNAEPSRLRSGTSWGLVGTGRCGIPASSAASAPVRTASTPGIACAARTSMRWMSAWACGERTNAA